MLQETLYFQENVKLKWLHRGSSEFSEQLDIIDCFGKYFLMQKMAFLLMPNICFYDAQIFYNNIFSISSGNSFDCNKILITMKKDVVLKLSTFQ